MWMKYFRRLLSSLLSLKRNHMSLPCYYGCQTSVQNQKLPSSPLHHTPNCVILQATQVEIHKTLPEHGPQQENPETNQFLTEE